MSALLASSEFPGRRIILVFFNSLMALPPVFVGLVLYILGFLDILYTPNIMIIAQIILILPIIISVGTETLEHLSLEYDELMKIMNLNFFEKIKVLLWDGRFVLMTCILSGLGRALSEVGAIIIVGGNIIHVTRVMTTSIALETSRGNLSLALSLGMILIVLAILLNSIALYIRYLAKKFSYD